MIPNGLTLDNQIRLAVIDGQLARCRHIMKAMAYEPDSDMWWGYRNWAEDLCKERQDILDSPDSWRPETLWYVELQQTDKPTKLLAECVTREEALAHFADLHISFNWPNYFHARVEQNGERALLCATRRPTEVGP
jgi:hypothetical protein